MATTKHLNLLLAANAQQMESTLSRVQRQFDTFKEHTSSVFGPMGDILPGIGSALSVGGLIAEMKAGVDSTLQLKSAADLLGISIGKVAGIKLMAGEDWSGAQSAIGKMLKTLGEAETGSAEAEKSLQLLNLSAANLAGLPTEKKLSQIIDRLRGIESPAQRAYAASLLFGKSWESMGEFLDKGSAGLNRAIADANRFGEVTEEQAQRAEKASEAWKAVKATGEELQRLAGSGLTWMMQNALIIPESKDDKAAATDLAANKALAAAQEKLIADVTQLEDRLKRQRDALTGGTSAVADFAARHKDATAAMLENARAMEKQIGDAKQNQEWSRRAATIIDANLSPYQRLKNELAEINLLHQRGKLDADQFAAALGGIGQKILENGKIEKQVTALPGLALEGTSEAASAIARWQESSRGPTEQVDTQKRIETILNDMRNKSQQQLQATQKVADMLGKIRTF